MTQQLPPGQGPIDPRGAFAPPPPPGGLGPVPQAPSPMRPMMQAQMPYPPFIPPPPPRRGGLGWALVTIVLVLLLLLSVVLNFILGAVAATTLEGHGIDETTITSGSTDQQVAVVPLEGILTDGSRKRFEQLLQHAEENKGLKGLVVDIDSPGGEVTPSDEIYQRLVKFKSDHPSIAIAASIRGMGASGAYYAACGCDHIVAEETTITGSIGVLWPNYNFSELMQKYGVKDTTVISSGTPYKDAYSPTRPPDSGNDGYIRGLVDSEFARFKAVVQKSRGSKLKPNIDDVANGKAYSAQEARQNGLVDDIGYLDKAVNWVATTARLSNPHVVRYEEKNTLLDRFPFARQHGSPQTVGLNVNGINVGIDDRLVERLMHPRPMAISRGQ